MKRDRTNEYCTPTLRQCLNAILFSLGIALAVAYIGPRDLEDAEGLAAEQSAAVVRAAQQVAEAK